MADRRAVRSREAIETAMLQLLDEKPLAEIGMTDVARTAGVSRSTLYAHYGNTSDIFQSLVESFAEGIRGLHTQLKCSSCQEATGKRPFCMAVRAAGKYQPLVLIPEFFPAFIEYVLSSPYIDEFMAPYLATGVTEGQARALFTFQLSGCYTAATTVDSMLWEENQQAIDQFIRGGINALRSMPQKH